jgi:transketolase
MNMQTIDTQKSLAWARDIRREIIEASHDVGRQGVHIGSALSVADILAVLYAGVLRYDAAQPESADRDFFILSKGHAYVGYYAALAKAGFFSNEDIKEQFMTDGGWLPVHPVKNLEKGVEFSGGSLGTGMPFSVGKAYALKLAGKPNKVYSLVGDGECDEGSIWEAFMSAAHLGLDNLTVIVDQNALQQDGPTEEILRVDIAALARACGWNVIEVDGHNHQELADAFSTPFENGKPKCIVAHTVKGKGVSFMENDNNWHHANMNEKQYQQAKEELQ